VEGNYVETQKIWQIVTACGLGLAALGGYFSWATGKNAQDEKDSREAMAGVLKAATPRSPTRPSAAKVYPTIVMGDSDARLAYSGRPGEPCFVLGDGEGVTVGLDDQQRIVVSAPIRDAAGALIAEIVNNEWKVNPARAFDRNYNANALEVLDEFGDVILQARLVGNTVRLLAKLRGPTGNGIAIGSGIGPDGQLGGILEPRLPKAPFTLKFARLFKYPSALHFGELARQEP
jgi:hypothetical protein